MTATSQSARSAPTHGRHAAPSPRGGRRSGTPTPGMALLAPLTGAAATISAATSLAAVIAGGTWLAYLSVGAVLVACTGLALRSLRAPALFVALGQLAALLALVTGAFTRHGILAIIPGPAAWADLNDLLVAAFDDIRVGIPPVEATAPILCLVTIAIGLVAVMVDTLVVGASAPAATGLILLCVYAVPSALADDLLPWWTFVLGAAAFAALLAVDGSHRHTRWRNRSSPGSGPSFSAVTAPVAMVASALAAGLLAGATITVVGTEGSLPGREPDGDRAPGGLGVNPFTSLRGMLDQGDEIDLFRVTGLGDDQRLLRAFTLDTYRPNEGWALADGPMPAGVPAVGELPAAPGDDGSGPEREIHIEPVHWNDVWLPVYGSPRTLRGLSDGWYYDRTSGAVFRERRQTPGPYVEVASLRQPSPTELRRVEPDADAVPAVYTDDSAIDPAVRSLTADLTASATTTYDRVKAVLEYFGTGNGFVYDESTAPATHSDALADFVLHGKRGYCEQYASSMAVMLRSQNIPARVAVGFAAGRRDDDVRTITSRDAHAWVEVYFGELGWVSVDPTPRPDRGYLPPHLGGDEHENTGADDETPTESAEPSPRSPEPSPSGTPEDDDTATPAHPYRSATDSGPGIGLSAAILALIALLTTTAALPLARRRRTDERSGRRSAADLLLALAASLWGLTAVLVAWWAHWLAAVALIAVMTLVLAPWLWRRGQHHRRLRVVDGGGPEAPDAAWTELVLQFGDRGVDLSANDTIRLAAQRVVRECHLDEQGQRDMRSVVLAVERSWYSPQPGTPATSADFARAVRGVLDALDRTAPLPRTKRMLPRWLTRRRARRRE